MPHHTHRNAAACVRVIGVLLLGLSSPAWAENAVAANAGPVEQTVVLTDFKFTPEVLTLIRDRPVVLHLQNKGSGGHSFSGKDFFAAVDLAPQSAALLDKGKVVQVAKNATVDLAFTPRRVGSYRIKCTHFLHSGFGMKGRVEISAP